MTDSVRDSIYEAIASIRLIDPHTHINPYTPASLTLADLLGYHYYTELAHSAGMPKDQIEEDGLAPQELVQRLVSNLSPIENTVQYRWLIEICRVFFGFQGDRIDLSNWEELYDAAEQQMRLADWPQMVLDQSNVEAVFLTNDFDDELTGFDTDTYIPCLRTDDLVFHLPKLGTRERLSACTGIELDGSLLSLRESLKHRFEHFVSRGARACAISLPPTFEPTQVTDGRAATALDEVLRKGTAADESHKRALSRRVFWTLAELCDEYGLPFDLMIGVNRGVYADGVFQGQDLYDSRVSLIQYAKLFNAFPAVKFPISVLASVTNQELVSYAWIFPNVITNGHWWYSNTPSFIARDAAARLEAVPQTKQIAYYSDAYKLEFVWPKFDMYRRVLAGVLAEQFVHGCGWSEERAIELGRQVLRDNIDEIFPRPPQPGSSIQVDPLTETLGEDTVEDHAVVGGATAWDDHAARGMSAALAAGSIGVVEVNEADESLAGEQDEADDELKPIPDTLEFSTIIEEPHVAEPRDEQADQVDDLDPLPSAEEIQAVDVNDVELIDLSAERGGPDSDAIEAEADPEPLDLNVFSEADDTPASEGESAKTPDTEIRLLRGEESFTLDEDSLQLQPDPLTGELTFPVPSSDDDATQPAEASDEGSAEASDEGSADPLVFDDADFDIHDGDGDSKGADEIVKIDDIESLDLDESSGEQTDPDDFLTL